MPGDKPGNIRTLLFRVHAVQRMFEREISPRSVRQAVDFGEVIEDYSNEMPEPGHLILGFQGGRPLHVVVSENLDDNGITVVTVYIPDPVGWKKGFRRRK